MSKCPELKSENERLKADIERLRGLLERCKDELLNVEPLSDSHKLQLDALYEELIDA